MDSDKRNSEARIRAMIDQVAQTHAALLPDACWTMYRGFFGAGFSEEQSLTLTATYLKFILESARSASNGS